MWLKGAEEIIHYIASTAILSVLREKAMSSVVVLQVSPGTDAGFEAALNGIYSIVDICPALFR